jgi:hypothetical protein
MHPPPMTWTVGPARLLSPTPGAGWHLLAERPYIIIRVVPSDKSRKQYVSPKLLPNCIVRKSLHLDSDFFIIIRSVSAAVAYHCHSSNLKLPEPKLYSCKAYRTISVWNFVAWPMRHDHR